MFRVDVSFSDNFPTVVDIAAEVERAKLKGLADAQAYLKTEQAAGRFPDDPDDYQLYLYNRGREQRRNFDTLDPRYLKIPFSLKWIASGSEATEAIKDAAIYALGIMRNRAPFYRGKYIASTSIYIGSRPISVSAFRAIELKETDLVAVAPDVAYASPIEAGYYKKQYDTPDAQDLRGGIIRPVAKMVRAKFGNEIACRFAYLAIGKLKTVGTMPAIELGAPGAFLQNDARPGTGRKNKRRSKR